MPQPVIHVPTNATDATSATRPSAIWIGKATVSTLICGAWVVVGAAETRFERPIAREVDSEAQVLRTAKMVRKDWRRTVIAPQVVPCLRQGFKKSLGSNGKLVSVGVVPFPRLATYTRAFRIRANINSPNGTVPMESYFVALGAGRNELSLSDTAIGADRASLRTDTLRLAHVLAHRMHS